MNSDTPSNDQKTASLILDGPHSVSALEAMSEAVYWAKIRNERVNSVHLLFGLASNSDSVSSTILNQTGFHLFKLKKALAVLPSGTFEGPFPELTAFLDLATEFEEVLKKSFELAEDSLELDTAHLLLGLLESPSLARKVLNKSPLGKELTENLKQFLQTRKHLNEI